MTVEFFRYQFTNPTEAEVKENVLAKVTVVATGVNLNNENERVLVRDIKFIPKKKQLVTIDDYKDVEVVFPDLSEIDTSQQESFKRRVYNDLYVSTYLKDPQVRAKITFPSDETFF